VNDADVRLHVDHVKPVASGGTNEPRNLATACQDCNLGKAANELQPIFGYREWAAEGLIVCDLIARFHDAGLTLSHIFEALQLVGANAPFNPTRLIRAVNSAPTLDWAMEEILAASGYEAETQDNIRAMLGMEKPTQ
jgi:hypothetical protein